ncbi:hypothetical protein CY34DRAFT_810194 [Suillus luteus UH-Slu-Lm8-n1]|uniref:Unplaced genomic scaffold CY34scaffold_311, whole genome shotgun sequence n=1 Tax=Suillus luteus UH-Slu-Lm8-n1 TaxID=930992 RepID=A0A0D0A7J0_9AGAM|nr:hypothetical protein CY34DRAFT_810194 [Suillus luteus UH-Slu-Lm8-n1]
MMCYDIIKFEAGGECLRCLEINHTCSGYTGLGTTRIRRRSAQSHWHTGTRLDQNVLSVWTLSSILCSVSATLPPPRNSHWNIPNIVGGILPSFKASICHLRNSSIVKLKTSCMINGTLHQCYWVGLVGTSQ